MMHFEIYLKIGHGLWYWRLVAANGRIVADGSEGYASKGNARRAVKRVQTTISDADIFYL